MVTISPFTSDDQAAVVSLLAEAMPADSISEARFTHQVLLDHNFRAEGAPVACEHGKVVGFCLSIARQVPLESAPSDADRGYITLLAVAPEARKRGVATSLLAHVENYLEQQNRKQIMVSSYAPNYFIPGVDVAAYEPALKFFAMHGYNEVYRPLAMQTVLWNSPTPSWVREKERELTSAGVTFHNYTPSLTVPLLDFARTEFPGDWVRVVRETAARILAGACPTRLIAAVDEGRVLAFSHYDNERFGPIGVAAAERGRCLGQVLMYKTLEAQRAAGFRAAWFLWSDDKTAARIYTAAGFRETRRFAVLRKDLA